MISFIVIGRNEGVNLGKCFNSIKHAIKDNNITNYEIIYVDSKSSDNSIEVAINHNPTHIFRIIGSYNAAIGRNIGGREAKGDILFFIDGDMEIDNKFLSIVLNEESDLIYPFISGNIINKYYNKNGLLISSSIYREFRKDVFQTTTFGIFIIKKKYWDVIEGMDVRFVTGEDLNLGLKMAQVGIKVLKKMEIIAIHNNIKDIKEFVLWKDLFTFRSQYSRGYLYRKNLFNKHIFKQVIIRDPTFLLLIINFSVIIVNPSFYLISYLIYLLLLGAAVFYKYRKQKTVILNRYFYYFIRDHFTILSLLFLCPRKKDILYEKIDKQQ